MLNVPSGSRIELMLIILHLLEVVIYLNLT